jgi:hypothetical protein
MRGLLSKLGGGRPKDPSALHGRILELLDKLNLSEDVAAAPETLGGAASKEGASESPADRRTSLLPFAKAPAAEESDIEQLSRRIAQLKTYLLGARDSKTETWVAPETKRGGTCDQVANEIIEGLTPIKGKMMKILIKNLGKLNFETRKDVAFIFEALMYNNYGGDKGADKAADKGARGTWGFKRRFMLQNLPLVDYMFCHVSSTEGNEEVETNALLYGKMLNACFDHGEVEGTSKADQKVKDVAANEELCYYAAKKHMFTLMRGVAEGSEGATPNYLQNSDFSMFMNSYVLFEKLMLCSCSRSAAKQAEKQLASSAAHGGGGGGDASSSAEEGAASSADDDEGSTVLAEYLSPHSSYAPTVKDDDNFNGRWIGVNEAQMKENARQFEMFFGMYHKFLLLESTSFALAFKAMKLLFNVLTHRPNGRNPNQRLMLEYIKSGTKLITVLKVGFFPKEKNRWGDMEAESGKSVATRKLRYEAFHVLKIFVCNPSRNLRINYLLAKNKDKLIARLDGARPNSLKQIECGADIGIEEDEFSRAKCVCLRRSRFARAWRGPRAPDDPHLRAPPPPPRPPAVYGREEIDKVVGILNSLEAHSVYHAQLEAAAQASAAPAAELARAASRPDTDGTLAGSADKASHASP